MHHCHFVKNNSHAGERAHICAHVTQVGGLLLLDRTKKKYLNNNINHWVSTIL